MGDKIDQKAETAEGSSVIQASGDVYVVGPTLPQILETVDFQIKSQFESLLYKYAPSIIQQEMSKVKDSIDNFNSKINERITEEFRSLLFSLTEDQAAKNLTKGVSDSNFQYLFKESIEQVIRKKDQAPQEVLVELLINKVKSIESNTDYLIEEAINTLKYLNKNHINFILFISEIINNTGIYTERPFQFVELTHLSQIKWTCYYFLEQDLSKIDIEYLRYKGLIFENKHYVHNPEIYDRIGNSCIPQEFKNKFNKSNEELVRLFLPEIDIILDKFGLTTPYQIDVLSKIADTICTKNRYNLMKCIEKYRDKNKEIQSNWKQALSEHFIDR